MKRRANMTTTIANFADTADCGILWYKVLKFDTAKVSTILESEDVSAEIKQTISCLARAVSNYPRLSLKGLTKGGQ
jgi:hypothetical protein